MTETRPAISDLTLERFRLDELPADEAARVADLARSTPALRERLDALRQSDEQARAGHLADRLAQSVRDRIDRPRVEGPDAARWPWRWAAAGGAVVILLVALTLPRLASAPEAPTTGQAPVSVDRVKGSDVALMVYRKSGAASEQLTDGDFAGTGDVIRVAYRVADRRFGAIVSIDGRGAVTRHLPVAGIDAAGLLQAGGPVLLETAYELDDAPKWEQFFLITAAAPFDVAPVVDAARRAAAAAGPDPPARLSLPAGLQQSTFLVRKTAKKVESR